MKINQVLGLLTLILIGFSISTIPTGCANIVPPLGGPKDTLPPVLVNVNPADSTLGFTGKKIILNFNEYVQLENIQKNLIVTPTPKVNPTIEQKLKTITITLRDTLEENTTYTIDFGRAIKDLNEGNPYPNY
ncbi:MAG: Ig-like domain-containing protein, partial [Chitinophagaceae bacterium]|nr:Ig-like domain-containing protein [Chitinophagaceae bacterium]